MKWPLTFVKNETAKVFNIHLLTFKYFKRQRERQRKEGESICLKTKFRSTLVEVPLFSSLVVPGSY